MISINLRDKNTENYNYYIYIINSINTIFNYAIILIFKGYLEYTNNNKWITELDNVEAELLKCILPSEQETIRNRSQAIKFKYQVIFYYKN